MNNFNRDNINTNLLLKLVSRIKPYSFTKEFYNEYILEQNLPYQTMNLQFFNGNINNRNNITFSKVMLSL
jgi:hypothetical protein